MNYENNMLFYEYLYSQSLRNWKIERSRNLLYNHNDVEQLKRFILDGGILTPNDGIEERLIEEPPEYEDEQIDSAVLKEMEEEYYKEIEEEKRKKYEAIKRKRAEHLAAERTRKRGEWL